MHQGSSRRLTTILAADVVGFSRLVAADEEGTLARLAVVRSAFAELIAGYRGRIFNTAGDAIRAEFQSASDAVRCARALQARAAEIGSGEAEAQRIRFRIGVALGDVVDSGSDILGDGVALAETLEAAAPAGGLCISRAVHDAVAAKSDIAFVAKDGLTRDGAPLPAYVADLAAAGSGGSAGAPNGSTSEPRNDTGKGGGMAGSGDGVDGMGAGGRGRGWLRLAALGALSFLAVFVAAKLLPQRPVEPAPAPAASDKPATPAATPTATPGATPGAAGDKKPAPSPAAGSSASAPSTAKPTSGQPAPAAASSGAASPSVAKAPDVSQPGAAANTPTARTDAVAPAFTRQWQDCAGASGDAQITACKALLDSPGTLSDADLGTINHHLGRARLQKGEVEPAIAALTVSVDKLPTPDAYVARGIAYHQKGDLEAAVRDFSEAIRRDGRNGEALNNRAWSRYKLKQLKDALADADAAVKLIADKSYAWDTRGHINEALGNKDAAVADYKKAIELDANARDSRDGLKRLGAAP